MSVPDDNDDLKAKMREALAKKQQPHDSGVAEGAHHKQKGPGERSRKGGSSLFRRKAGG